MRSARLGLVSLVAACAVTAAILGGCSSGAGTTTPTAPTPPPVTFSSGTATSSAATRPARTLVAVAGRTPPRILLIDARNGSGVATLTLPAAPVALRGRYVLFEAGRLASSTGLLGTFDTSNGRLSFTRLPTTRPTGLLVARLFGLVLTDIKRDEGVVAERFPVVPDATAGPSPGEIQEVVVPASTAFAGCPVESGMGDAVWTVVPKGAGSASGPEFLAIALDGAQRPVAVAPPRTYGLAFDGSDVFTYAAVPGAKARDGSGTARVSKFQPWDGKPVTQVAPGGAPGTPVTADVVGVKGRLASAPDKGDGGPLAIDFPGETALGGSQLILFDDQTCKPKTRFYGFAGPISYCWEATPQGPNHVFWVACAGDGSLRLMSDARSAAEVSAAAKAGLPILGDWHEVRRIQVGLPGTDVVDVQVLPGTD